MSAAPAPPRKVLHVDMDAFYAAVEQRDRPELRGRPIIVGGDPAGRGVVCTASYEARRFGVRSAMPAARARRLCPAGIFLRPDFERYAAVSRQIREIFLCYSDRVEPLSLDEAYLDVTVDRRGLGSATRVARAVRADIRRETGLTASAGVGPNKFVAKVASDLEKPDGLVVVPPERVATLLATLPVRCMPGVGPVTEAACHRRGIRLCSDFLRHDAASIRAWFGSHGARLLELAQGIDPRPVDPGGARRSVSIEDTFPQDLAGTEAVHAALARLAGGLAERLVRHDLHGRTVTVKVRYGDFRTITRSRTVDVPFRDRGTLAWLAARLLDQTEAARRPVRLLGVGMSHLEEGGDARQAVLAFCTSEPETVEPEGPA